MSFAYYQVVVHELQDLDGVDALYIYVRIMPEVVVTYSSVAWRVVPFASQHVVEDVEGVSVFFVVSSILVQDGDFAQECSEGLANQQGVQEGWSVPYAVYGFLGVACLDAFHHVQV